MAKKEIVEDIRNKIPVTDIKGMYLYRKDGYVLSYLRVYPFNLELKERGERKAITSNLVSGFLSDRRDFMYQSFPREVDLDEYKETLKGHYQNNPNTGKRKILEIMLRESRKLITNGENFEHQHFLKIWRKESTVKKAEESLKERIFDIKNSYEAVGIRCDILRDEEIIKLCNLYSNNQQSAYEIIDDYEYEHILQI